METHSEHSAGGIVLGDSGTIAMIRDSDAWLFPYDRLDGRDDETAARRTIMERTGLTNLELIDDLGSYAHIRMFLFAAPMHAELSPTQEREEARWVPLKNVITEIGNVQDRAWFTTVFERVRQAVQRD